MKPLCIELFAGCFGWGRGFVAEGFKVVGFDILHENYHGDVPEGCSLVLQDVLTLHGSQFRNAAVIVASPPCQEYSWMAMPFSRGKRKAEEYRNGTRDVADLTRLFDACFRIQREASEAAGRHIPMVVENVKGAQPWVGRAKWHYGSFYLWGDVPAIMPIVGGCAKIPGQNWNDFRKHGKVSPVWNMQKQTIWFNDDKRRAVKNGGYWYGSGTDCSLMRQMSSKSKARKAASAQIAKIPFDLARYIAQVYKPHGGSV